MLWEGGGSQGTRTSCWHCQFHSRAGLIWAVLPGKAGRKMPRGNIIGWCRGKFMKPKSKGLKSNLSPRTSRGAGQGGRVWRKWLWHSDLAGQFEHERQLDQVRVVLCYWCLLYPIKPQHMSDSSSCTHSGRLTNLKLVHPWQMANTGGSTANAWHTWQMEYRRPGWFLSLLQRAGEIAAIETKSTTLGNRWTWRNGSSFPNLCPDISRYQTNGASRADSTIVTEDGGSPWT